MLIKISELEQIVNQIILTKYSEEQAAIISEVILFGEISGKKSHGILRLIKGSFGIFDYKTKEEPEYIYKSKLSTIIDAKGSPGMLAAPLAMQEVIRLAKDHDIGLVGVRGYYNTTGAISYYCEKIAKENLICLIFPQSSPTTAPFNVKEALFGTNPIAFGIPSYPQPIIFDMSTSAIAWGTILKHKLENNVLPENVALDKTGNITTDPQKAVTTLPFDASYKGSGLAMIVELFGGLLTGASFEGLHINNGNGSLFLAFSPELLQNLDEFKQKTSEFIETLRKVKTRDGNKVRIPGENTLEIRKRNLEKGEVEVNKKTIEELNKLISDL